MKNSKYRSVKTKILSVKSISALLIFMLFSVIGRSQENMVHTGEYISIKSGTEIYVLGSFDSRSTVTLPVINQGVFNLQGDLIHDGQYNLFGLSISPPNEGTLRFYGSPLTNSSISGSNPINLKHFIIDLDQDITGGGNVLLRKNNVTSYGDISFTNGGFELDTNVFNLYHDPSSVSSGIISESNEARPYLGLSNTVGKISLQNYPFSSGSTYSNLKGMGLGFTQDDPFGGTPVLYRTFDTLDCGDTPGSILRAFQIEGNTNPAQFSNPSINFLNASELGLNPNGTNLNIFVSEDQGQVWRPKNMAAGTSTQTNSTGSSRFFATPNYSIVTAATPCGSLLPIEINQIITGVVPNDTLFNITDAVACDPLNISAYIYATGDTGVYFEWRNAVNNFYVAQDPPGYFEATQLGTYWVKSTNIRGCVDSMSVDVILSPASTSDFTPSSSSVCLGNSISFTPDDAQVGGYTYSWDFGDGNTATTYSASHTYAAIGSYTVTLEVTTSQGCVSSQTSTVIVKAIPVASFTAGAACPGAPVTFDNGSTVVGYTGLVSLDWDFGDLTIGTTQGNQSGVGGDTTHIYTIENTYTVTLTATANGCVSLPVTQNITVYPIPVSSFTVSNACAGQSVSFNNASSISDATTLTYLWNFTGVGPTSSTTNPVYSYPLPNTYNVILISTSVNGCADTLIQPVTIYENPSVDFNVTNACVNNPAAFSDVTPVITGSTPYTYVWDFGDGNNGTLANETNIYTVAGTYTVSLVLTTANGCVGSSSESVTIYPGPSVSFSALDACANSPISFVNTSSNASSYSWDFPSISVITTSQNTVQTFPTDGTFPVNLTATSSNGCQNTFNGSITVYPLPVVNLGTTIITCGTTYLLDANPGGINNGSTFSWGTGDVTPQYTVTYDGIFDVTVTSGSGCVTTDAVDVTLNGNVVPDLGTTTSFCDSAVLDAGYPGSTYLWGGGETSQTITALASGTYSVTVTDQNGCVGSNSINITIVPGNPVSLGNDITACSNNPVLLDAGTAADYLWSDNSTSQTLLTTTTGYYWVRVNSTGCVSYDTILVTYNPAPVFSLGPDTTVCEQIVLNGFTVNCSYQWNTSDITPSINVTSSGTYILTVTNTTTLCSNTDTNVVTVNPLPTVSLGNDTSICSYNSIVLDAGAGFLNYVWNSGPTSQTISVASSGNYVVTVTDVNNCTNSDDINVTMLPLFSFDLGIDQQFCPGSTIVLDAGLTTTGNSYLWEDETGVLATTTTYQVLDTGMHYLTVTDQNNCVATDSINIIPSNISLYAVFLADSEIEVGESVVFVNLSYPDPFTSAWYLDNVFITSDSMPTITFNMPITPPSDTVYVKLEVNNVYCTSSLTKPIVINSAFHTQPGELIARPPRPELFSEINSVNLYPNPNTGLFNFMIDVSSETVAEIEIFSLTGSLIFSEKRTVFKSVIPYDFDELESGLYFLRVRIFNEARTLKFVITN